MNHRTSFANGRHVAAARTLAGLKQTELAVLAGLHVNSVKRLEKMKYIYGSEHTVRCIGEALRGKGIIAERYPSPVVRLTPPT